jgi:hypothetical protein
MVNSGKIIRVLNNKYFLVLLIFIPFAIRHMVFFLYYPVPEFNRDSYGYWEPVLKMVNGEIPIFNIRTPGYPLFLYFVNFFQSIKAILVVQSCLSIIAVFIIIILISKEYREILFPISLSLFIFINSPGVLSYDTAILSENLYTNLLLLSFTFLIIACKTNTIRYWYWLSITTGLLIITRPQGILVLPNILIVIIVLWRVLNFKIIIAIALPVSIILVLILSYNFITIGRFVLTDLTFLNNLGPTITYVEPDNKYDYRINKCILEFNERFPKNQKEIIENTWNLKTLSKSFSCWDSCFILVDQINVLQANDSSGTYYKPENILKARKVINQIGKDSKRKHLDLYLKFVYNSFIRYNINLNQKSIFYYTAISNRAYWIGNKKEMFAGKPTNKLVEINFKEYEKIGRNERSPKYIQELNSDTFYAKLDTLPYLVKAQNYFDIVFNILFRNLFWVFLFYLSYILVIIKLVKINFKNIDYLILFVTGNFLVFSALFVSLFQYPIFRLSFPTEYFYYALPLLYISILLKNKYKALNNVMKRNCN